MSESLGKKNFSKLGLLSIVMIEELNRENGIKPSNSRKALEKAMMSDLLKLSRKEIEEMAVAAKKGSWGYYVQFTDEYIKSRDLFKTQFYKSRTSSLILSDLELIQEVEVNSNLESFYYIGSYLTKADAIDAINARPFTPSSINVLDIRHIKYLAEN